MKTQLCSVLFVASQLQLFACGGYFPAEDYVAHEWGTFTSVQAADGIPLEWNPLNTTDLPAFVYDRNKPGGDPHRRLLAAGTTSLFSKSTFRTFQRMETPVIYFYSPKERTVDVSVQFPQGLITEWYPHARDIGPSTMQPRPLFAAIDNAAGKTGLPALVNLSSLDTRKGITNSVIRWADVKLLPTVLPHVFTDCGTFVPPNGKVLPTPQLGEAGATLPHDKSASHYYAARETDANLVSVQGSAKVEHERFLFYRGIGNFATPLRVSLSGGNEEQLLLHNDGKEVLAHLFVLRVSHGEGKFVYFPRLSSEGDANVKLDSEAELKPLPELVKELRERLRASLVSEGLYEREATAMVNTWRDSWIEEPGLRVLYVLPRAWTDRVLPLTLDPKPRQTVRVMVGRAEVITPNMEWELLKQVVRYSDTDASKRPQVVAATRELGLGRFLEPTTRRLMGKVPDRQFNQLAWELMDKASKPVVAKSSSIARK